MIGIVGVPAACYEHIVTSGDLARAALRAGAEPAIPGAACFHLGPERDRGLFEGLDMPMADDLTGAGFILNTGLFDDEREDE